MILFILTCFGLTQILVYSKLFENIRPKYHFFHCPMCVGWWTGLFLWSISCFTTLFIFDRNIITGFMLACLSSGTSYILSMLFGDKGININETK